MAINLKIENKAVSEKLAKLAEHSHVQALKDFFIEMEKSYPMGRISTSLIYIV